MSGRATSWAPGAARRRRPGDLKTATKRYTQDQLAYDHQPTAYELAARAVGLGEVGLRYPIVTKTPVIQVVDVERDARAEDDFLRTAGGLLPAADSRVVLVVVNTGASRAER